MDIDTRYVLNDLLDVVEKLTEIVRELNPGADLSLVDFLMERANRALQEP